MQYIALTGISSQVLKELQENCIRTIEIHSPHNFLSVYHTEVGDLLFLTKSSYNDIKTGTIGILAKIKERHISMHRFVSRSQEMFEECETFAARIQLQLQGIARVRTVGDAVMGSPFFVDADSVTYLEAK
ncbi:MAG: DUF473 domain-containing protein [ANME-2 cluster archaeon]|nr:DUF473 domain-containing protein [ANME-2 cluster archaeon]MCL7475793.1 DUF473 domain-containing protein [ANME-2 cluster archaeon]MDF1531432.1 DUF473 domain-containing protein [ANME-2 cluster archaeon]MDW7775877.1 DUF473 domain-containing protein [Methanosarcinales archaeon]